MQFALSRLTSLGSRGVAAAIGCARLDIPQSRYKQKALIVKNVTLESLQASLDFEEFAARKVRLIFLLIFKNVFIHHITELCVT